LENYLAEADKIGYNFVKPKKWEGSSGLSRQLAAGTTVL
jgi:hypothetical protein